MITEFLYIHKSGKPKRPISIILLGLIIFISFFGGRLKSADVIAAEILDENKTLIIENTTAYEPSPTPTKPPIIADIWLPISIDQKIITPQTTIITGIVGFSYNYDTVIRVSINRKVVAEKILTFDTETFSINVDFSKCKKGDEVLFLRELSETIQFPPGSSIGIWNNYKRFEIEDAADPEPTSINTPIPTLTPTTIVTPSTTPSTTATPTPISLGNKDIENHIPIVSKYKGSTTRVTGKSLPYTTVYAKIERNVYKSTVRPDGTYSIKTSKLVENQKIAVYIKNTDGYKSKTKTVTVQPIIRSHTPIVRTPRAGDKDIKGKTLKNVKVIIKINNKLYHIKSTAKGNYKLVTAKLRKGGIVKIWAKDKNGAISAKKTVIVK